MFRLVAQLVRKKYALALVTVVALGIVAAAANVLWQTAAALREAGREAASDSEIAFAVLRPGEAVPATVHTVGDSLAVPGGVVSKADSGAGPATFGAPGSFEWISAPAVFTDAVQADDTLYVAGPAGIFQYNLQGSLEQHYRVGLDLPAAPPAAVAIGVSTASIGRSLYVATAGEGLLILDGLDNNHGEPPSRPQFQQIRAREAAYRDLTAVLPLDTGRVLLGTRRNGVLVYDGKRLAHLHPSVAELQVTALAGEESDTWIGTVGEGLLRWQGGRLDRFGEAEGLPDRQVLSLALDDSRLFVGTPLGVAEFRAGRFTRELAPGFFASSLLVRGEKLLVGTLDEGVVEVPLEAARPRGPRLESRGLGDLETVAVHRLLEVSGSAYALAADGLYALGPRAGEPRQVLQRQAAVLTDGNISALSVDDSGRLWVGYFDRGLDILEASLDRARHLEDEHLFCVNRIVQAPAKQLTAVATANGLVMFDATAKPRQILGRGEGLLSNHVTDVWFGATGMIAATPAGITFLDASGSRSLYAFHGLVNNHVYTLAAAGDRLLAGTLGGLSVLDAGVVRTSYTTGNSELKHNWITSIVKFDEDWFVGTYGAGVLRLDEAGRWHSFPDAAKPLEINPNAMAAGEGRVYAGALGEGLYVYERGSGRWRAITAGLPSRNVTALTLAGGYLYVGTDNGLVRVAESGL